MRRPTQLTPLTPLLLGALLTPAAAAAGGHDNGRLGHHGNNCSAVFEQGAAWVRWSHYGPETEPLPGAAYCVIQKFDRRRTEGCLERWRRRRQTTFEAYFIGDSRAREFFHFFSPRTGAEREVGRGKDNCLEWFNRTYEPAEEPHGRDHWCSYKRQGRLITTTYLWRHHVDGSYMASVRQLLGNCQLGSCPQLLVANGGMHAVWRYYGNSTARGLQAFGKQMHQLAPLLQQLAEQGVTVVWMLNEPMMEDAGGGFVRMHPEVVWLMNQVAVSVLGRYRSVLVWSSHLSVALWYHELCRSLGYPRRYGFACNDTLHLGEYAYENYLDVLLNYVCRGLVDMPDSNCCGHGS